MNEEDAPTAVYTRRIDSRRFSVGPVVYARERSCPTRCVGCFRRLCSFMEKVIRESTAISCFCLLIVWISYFADVLDRDVLLVCNGVLLAMMVIAGLLKRKHMQQTLRERRLVRRPFPRGAILRSASHPDLPEEDQGLTRKIRSQFTKHLLSCTSTAAQFRPSETDCHACVICLLEFEGADMVQVLNCTHFFHYDCLLQWCETQLASTNGTPSCPTCREEINITEDEMERFIAQVSAPEFLGPQLSRRVHIVFQRGDSQ